VLFYFNYNLALEYKYFLNLGDSKISAFVLDPLIVDTFHSYYGKKPLLRNDPLLQKNMELIKT